MVARSWMNLLTSFSGNGLNVIKIMPETAIKFGSYEAAKRFFANLEGHGDTRKISTWSKFTAVQRTECLLKLVGLLEEQLIPILTLDSLTGGNPVSLIPTREKNYIKNGIIYYAGWTDKQKGDYFPADDGTPAP